MCMMILSKKLNSKNTHQAPSNSASNGTQLVHILCITKMQLNLCLSFGHHQPNIHVTDEMFRIKVSNAGHYMDV